jgi:hypothetical protein
MTARREIVDMACELAREHRLSGLSLVHLQIGEADAVALVSALPFYGHLDRARAAGDVRFDTPGTADFEWDRLVTEE